MVDNVVCTCPGYNDDQVFVRDDACPIHTERMSSVSSTSPSYLLVCLCDCDCTRCDKIPVKKLISKGFALTILLKDNKGNNRFLKLIEETEEEGDRYDRQPSRIQGSTGKDS